MFIAIQNKRYGKWRLILAALRECWQRGEYTVLMFGGFTPFSSQHKKR